MCVCRSCLLVPEISEFIYAKHRRARRAVDISQIAVMSLLPSSCFLIVVIIIIISLIYTCYTAGYSQAGEGERDFCRVFFNGGILTVCPVAAILVKGAGRGEASGLEDRGARGDLEH